MFEREPSKRAVPVAALLLVLGVASWTAWSPAPGGVRRTAMRPGAPGAVDTVARDTTRARIVNETDYTMRIDLLPSSGARRYLGTIVGFDSASYVLADYQMGPTRTIRFVAHPVGGPGDIPSGEIYVGPGETVEWRIRPPLPFRGTR